MKYLLIITILLFSCTKKSTPDSLLSSYINHRFSKDFEVSDFSNYFRGDLLQDMLDIKGDELDKFNQVKKLKKKSFKINYTRCEELKCFITYTLSYLDDGKANVLVKVKKIAELTKLEASWRIVSISDVKSHYDFK